MSQKVIRTHLQAFHFLQNLASPPSSPCSVQARSRQPKSRLVYHPKAQQTNIRSAPISPLAVTCFLLTLSSYFNILSRSFSSLSSSLLTPLPSDFCPQPTFKNCYYQRYLYCQMQWRFSFFLFFSSTVCHLLHYGWLSPSPVLLSSL